MSLKIIKVPLYNSVWLSGVCHKLTTESKEKFSVFLTWNFYHIKIDEDTARVNYVA